MAHTPTSQNIYPFTDEAFNVPHNSYTKLSHINKFGRNTDIGSTEEDIWDGGGLYTFSTTADITHVVSSTADTVDIEIQGLDADWEEVVQTVSLNGTTAVPLTTPLIRVFRLKNVDIIPAVGNVQVGVGTTTTSFAAGDLRGQISAGFNQSLMAIYTVPAGCSGYLTNHWANANKSNVTGAVDVSLFVRDFEGVFRVQATVGLIMGGSSLYQHPYNPYPRYAEKTDIIMSATGSTNNFDVSAGFDLIIHDNELP